MNSFKVSGLLVLIVAVIVLLPPNAMAAITFQYSQTPSVDIFQQTQNSPCVIGNPSCNQPSGLFYDSVTGNPPASYDFFSTVYQAASAFSFGSNQIPLSFFVGVDDNFDNDHEFLVAFNTYTCTGPVSSANSNKDTTVCAGGVLDANNSWSLGNAPTFAVQDMSLSTNGNGFSNFILKGFSLTAGTFYAFEAKVSNDSDGTEQFFLIPAGTPAVPEPTSILMLGTALLGIGAVARRRLRARRP